MLHKMENDGLVTAYRQKADSGKERKYYHITPAGLEALADETEQWNVFSSAVNKVILGSKLSAV